MRRVLVIGSGGSGKTTVATRLAEALQLPLVHLDALYWSEGWQPTAPEQWQRTISELVQRDAWVMDGNYGGSLAARMSAADTVVFLDIPRLTCLWRVLKRHIRYFGRSRPSMAPGCPERLTREFVGWIWKYPARRRPGILDRLAEAAERHKTVVVLRDDNEVERFLESLVRRAEA